MKKRTLAMLLAACMTAGMLTACGGTSTNSAPAEQSTPATEEAAPTVTSAAEAPEPAASQT